MVTGYKVTAGYSRLLIADIARVHMIHEYLKDILWSNIYKCIHDSY